MARNFYQAGHNVVGADFEPLLLPISAGRVSRSLKTFYRMSKPDGGPAAKQTYTNRLLEIIRREKVDIWVSCSGVASAVEDGYAKEVVEQLTHCKAIQFDVATTEQLHEKHSFIEHVRDLGLSIPETYTVRSKKGLMAILHERNFESGTKYVLKYIGTDDSVRGDMTLLPLESRAKTEAHVDRLGISDDRPWILQQYISGPEFCTHALVVAGEVKAFVACPSAELLMHYTALPAGSNLTQSMLRFTQEVAAAGGPSSSGHLSFDFMVDQADWETAMRSNISDVKLYPIECNPRAHTAVVLFNDTPEMADAYMSLFEEHPASRKSSADRNQLNGTAKQPIFPHNPSQYYWIGNDLITRGFLSLLRCLRGQLDLKDLGQNLETLSEHARAWRDGTFEVWDPWPAFWLYHVYWPLQFLLANPHGTKWSRVNVSTCKMFTC